MGTLRAAGSAGVKSDRAELALSLSRTLTDGFSASSRGTEDDGFRGSSASLHGRYALVTGARVKIGYQAALKLLRAGAHVVVTTRFPVEASTASKLVAVRRAAR